MYLSKQLELEDAKEVGFKLDDGKPRFSLLPSEALFAVSQTLTDACSKYPARNWELGMNWSRPFDALQRHLWAWWSGEDKDPESGKSHLWHVLCNACFLLTFEARGTGTDDRPSKPVKTEPEQLSLF